MARHRLACAVVFVLTCATTAGCGDPDESIASASATATVDEAHTPPPAVMQAAQRFYQSGTVSGQVEWIRTTTQKAASLTQAQHGARDIPIYVAQAHGQFRLDNVSRPLGAESPEGTVLLTYFPVEGDPPEGASGLQLSSTPTDLSPFGHGGTFAPTPPRPS